MDEKILTVTVPSYNVQAYLEDCLESFVNSEVMDDIEVLIVNDGSSDDTATIAERYVSKYENTFRLINKENGGHGSTINTGAREARGKYFKVVDADDWVSKKGIEKLVEFLKTTDCDLIINPYIETYITELSEKVIIPYKNVENNKIYMFDKIAQNLDIPMHSMTLKTSIIKSVGPVIDENCFYVDMEYDLYPIKYVQTICCLDYPVYYYLLGNQEQSVSKKNMVKRRAQREKVIKSLIKDYNSSYNILGKSRSDYVATKIKYLIYTHYKMYMYLDLKTSYNEITEFDKWLYDNANEDIYFGLSRGLVMKFIRGQRKISFKLYKVTLKFAQLFGFLKIYKIDDGMYK